MEKLTTSNTYDPHCQDLAEVFLSEELFTTKTLPQHTARVRALSLEIQQAIENWIEEYPLDEWLERYRPEEGR